MSVVSITEDIDIEFVDSWLRETVVNILMEVAVLVTEIIFNVDTLKVLFNLWWCRIDDVSSFWIFLQVSKYLLCKYQMSFTWSSRKPAE